MSSRTTRLFLLTFLVHLFTVVRLSDFRCLGRRLVCLRAVKGRDANVTVSPCGVGCKWRL